MVGKQRKPVRIYRINTICLTKCCSFRSQSKLLVLIFNLIVNFRWMHNIVNQQPPSSTRSIDLSPLRRLPSYRMLYRAGFTCDNYKFWIFIAFRSMWLCNFIFVWQLETKHKSVQHWLERPTDIDNWKCHTNRVSYPLYFLYIPYALDFRLLVCTIRGHIASS